MIKAVPELLSPAGSLDAARAALANGANAIYLGAERFNARDDGAQLTLDEVGEACRLAHARGARVYLTFNILFKPSELPDALHHLGECIDRGIDAAIVQDLGAIRLIRQVYPDLEIHGSTQMTVHDGSGARVLQSLGVERVVLARENTLDDLRSIRAAVPDLGLETFIHGALCIAYSGQCFMSGMISERSANRGSCAQSCRKDYVLTDALTGAELDRGYLISAKDLAAAEHLDAIAEVGIGCLKVEGRKKKPEYVATVTRTYRGFLDSLAAGRWHAPRPEEMQPLVQIFSRGFTPGMFGGREGREYVTRAQPDNRGAVLGRVGGWRGTPGRLDAGTPGGLTEREIAVIVSSQIAAGDGLGFEHPEGPAKGNIGFQVRSIRTLGERRGKWLQAIATDEHVPEGWIVVRSSQASLMAGARESYAGVGRAPERREAVEAIVGGRAGSALTLTLRLVADPGCRASATSAGPLTPATKHALDEPKLREQLGRLGDTPFVLTSIDRSGLEDGLFLPVSVLNDMRREAAAELQGRVDAMTRGRLAVREGAIGAALGASDSTRPTPAAEDGGRGQRPGRAAARLVAEVFAIDQARVAAAAGADEISLDLFIRHPTPPVSRVRALADELAAQGITLRLRTPTIVRPEERKVLDKWLALDLPVTTGHIGLVAELAASGRNVVADYAVNCFNEHSAAVLFGLGAERIVLSVELTTEEMSQVTAPWQGAGFDVFLYGRPEGMTIEHCALSAAFDREPTTCRDLCVRKHTHTELTDPAGYTFPVATDSACRNRLLHSRPVNGAEYLPALWAAGLRNYRLVFNVPGDPVEEMTRAYREGLDALAAGRRPDVAAIRARSGGVYTRGHFARAV
jgi:putative protease